MFKYLRYARYIPMVMSTVYAVEHLDLEGKTKLQVAVGIAQTVANMAGEKLHNEKLSLIVELINQTVDTFNRLGIFTHEKSLERTPVGNSGSGT